METGTAAPDLPHRTHIFDAARNRYFNAVRGGNAAEAKNQGAEMLTGIEVLPVAFVLLFVTWAFVLIGSRYFGSTD